MAFERKVGVYKFFVSSGRGWSRRGSVRSFERFGFAGFVVRLFFLRSSMVWKSEVVFDDF